MKIWCHFFINAILIETAFFTTTNKYDQETLREDKNLFTTINYDEPTEKNANSEENKMQDEFITAEKNTSENEFTPVINNDLFDNKSHEFYATEANDLEINQNVELSTTEINDGDKLFDDLLVKTTVPEIENQIHEVTTQTTLYEDTSSAENILTDSGNDILPTRISKTKDDEAEEISDSSKTNKYYSNEQSTNTDILKTGDTDSSTFALSTTFIFSSTTENATESNEIIDEDEYYGGQVMLKILKAKPSTEKNINNTNTTPSTFITTTDDSTSTTDDSFSTIIYSSTEKNINNTNTAPSTFITTTDDSTSTTDDSFSTIIYSSTEKNINNTNTTPSTFITTTDDSTSTTDVGFSTIIYSSSTESSSTTESTDSTTEITTTTQNPCAGNLKVQNLKVKSSNFSLFVYWASPLPENSCDFKFTVEWGLKSTKTVFSSENTDKTDYTIKNLEACEEYIISVAVLYLGVKNDPVSYNTRTLESMENIMNINQKYDTNNSSITISWGLPSRVTKCLKNYVFHYLKDNNSICYLAIPSNEITLQNISGCHNNTFIVYAQSEHYKSAGVNTTYLEPKLNDPPIFNLTELYDDYVITKWNFGEFICQPEIFSIKCTFGTQNPFQVLGEITNDGLVAKIENVEPYTNYSCCGIISNQKGDSNCSKPEIFLTKSKAPEVPNNLTIIESEENLSIKWDPPEKWNGIAENYSISIEFIEFNYELPNNCEGSSFLPYFEILETLETKFNFKTIIPASKYKISVRAKSDGGWGEIIEEEVDLQEATPEKPRIEIQVIHSANKEYNTSLSLNWDVPCKMNGELQAFVIKLWNEDESDYRKKELPAPVEHNCYVFWNLKPDKEYIIQIQAKNNKYDGDVSKKTFRTLAGIPKKPSKDKLRTTSDESEPWNSAVVYLSDDLFSDSLGKIMNYSIIVAPKNCREEPKNEYYNPEIWPEVRTDNSADSSCTDELSPYEAIKGEWNPSVFFSKIAREYKFILGKDSNCTKKDCNKPLKPDTEYCVKIRGFTKNGYRDTDLLYFTTDVFSDVPVGLIIGLIVGILAIAFVIAFALFYKKGKLNFKNWPRMQSNGPISPTPLPVPIKKFGTYYKNMIENPGKIKNEFQLLSTISSDLTLSTKTALLPINKKKNRYLNILPYDETRVLLRDINANSTDYINASYILGYCKGIEYIASQGPTEATHSAFWQMILEQNVKLIVMLTQFVEAGKDKCFKYFPDLNDLYEINDVTISCVEEELMNVYNKRLFKIQKGNVVEKITHIQYNLWPDFGVPKEVNLLIDFCETMDEIKIKKPGLILIHCSAGVGRTGTLIAMDILMQTIRDKRKVDIFGTVLNLRKQRMNMVQSERQYEFLYKCVYHVITNQMRYSSSKRNSSTCESDIL